MDANYVQQAADLMDIKCSQALKKRMVWWLHTAPLCSTFSAARTRDKYAKADSSTSRKAEA